MGALTRRDCSGPSGHWDVALDTREVLGWLCSLEELPSFEGRDQCTQCAWKGMPRNCWPQSKSKIPGCKLPLLSNVSSSSLAPCIKPRLCCWVLSPGSAFWIDSRYFVFSGYLLSTSEVSGIVFYVLIHFCKPIQTCPLAQTPVSSS